jgi:trigger factor
LQRQLDDTRAQLTERRSEQTRMAVRDNLAAELAKLVDADPPEAMVSGEMEGRMQNLAYQLQGRGIGLDDYLRITGRDPETFTAELQEASDEAVRTDLALRAVAVAEGLEVAEDEIDHEIVHLIGDADVTV